MSILWSPQQDLNLRPIVYKTIALPTELQGHEVLAPRAKI